jgi:predicted CXXCH cytochrome family protein
MPARLAALALLAALLAAPPARAVDEESPSAGSALPRRCGVCHLDRAPGAPSGVIAFAPPPRAAGAGERGMCYSCHNGLVKDSRRSQWTGRHHPASGAVQCGSCHSPHVRSPGLGPFMKYAPGNYAFCGSCHAGRRKGEPGEHPAVPDEKGKSQDCGACHVVHGAVGAGLIREVSAEALCGPCHGENPSREGKGPGKTTHRIGGKGPACLDCHSVHKTPGGRGLLVKAVLDGRLCRQCHEGAFSAKGGEGNHPLAPDQVNCLSCHRMHNAADPGHGKNGLLVAPRAELEKTCRRCHEDLAASGAAWNHPLGGSIAAVEGSRGARLAEYGAFFAPGAKVTCLSCHRAHGAPVGTPGLVVAKNALCFYCHPRQNSLDMERAVAGAHPVAVQPRRASIPAAFLEAGGETGKGGELTCVTCHRGHRGRPGTAGLVLGRDVYSCLLCHRDEASIASTAHGSVGGAAGLCAGCHGEHGWKQPVSAALEQGTAIEQICLECHREDGRAAFRGFTNHPVNVTPPSGSVPYFLPLFWRDGRRLRQGVLTCATCHDVHRNPRGNFLRAAPGGREQELCIGCHARETTVIGTRHDLGKATGTVCSPCHPVHDPEAAGSWPAPGGGAARKNPDLALFCGRCHRKDGAGTKAVEPVHPPRPPGVTGGGNGVGCEGCHDPHRWNPSDSTDRGGPQAKGDAGTSFLLRPANGTAGLCAGCHAGEAAVTASPHDLTPLASRGGLPPGLPDPRREGVCGVCHRIHGGDPLFLWSAPLAGGSKRAEPCERCHGPNKLAPSVAAGGYAHPVGVSPGQDIGPDLPLYAPSGRHQPAGRIGCGTCHDPHRWSPTGETGGLPKAASSFLRLGADNFAPLCFPCHAEKSMVVGTDHDLRVTAPASANLHGESPEGSGVCGACHAVHGAEGPIVLWNRPLGEGKDLQSRMCRGCHRPGDASGARVPPRVTTHLVNYPGRGLVDRVFSLARTVGPEGAAGISLYSEQGARAEQGYLSCGSCHDVHRWEPDVNRSGEGLALEGDITNSFLRARGTLAVSRSFCAECHGEAAIDYYRTYHFPEGK